MSAADDPGMNGGDSLGSDPQPFAADGEFNPPIPLAEFGEEPLVAEALTECWRCHKSVPETRRECPFCEATLRRMNVNPTARLLPVDPSNPYASTVEVVASMPDTAETELAQKTREIVRLMWFFAGMLVVSLIGGAVATKIGEQMPKGANREAEELKLILVFEAIDTVLVLAALAVVGRPSSLGERSTNERLLGWMAGLPILVGVLAVNYAYHRLLMDYLKMPQWALEQARLPREPMGLAIAAICLQPAVVEELFFRYLALGLFRRISGVHTAVWVSAIMFGMAHIGVPLSIPVLIFVGLGLGYSRVLSGSMLLPMILHFAHNAVVLYWEPFR